MGDQPRPRRIAVVGGGAAGIFAALSARREGADVCLLERNARLGIKILISGGGKCNITHDAPSIEIEKGFIRREGRFLRYALHEFSPHDLLAMLADVGLQTVTRPNGRVFPESGRAEEVLAACEELLDRASVDVVTDAHVERLAFDSGRVTGLWYNDRLHSFDAVIVATGGMSYRKVGTTGDGIRWAEESGHHIERVRAALAPIYFEPPPPADWQGVALRDVRLRLESADGPLRFPKGEELHAEWRDDLLLTHRGISGPAVLEVSRAAARGVELYGALALRVDLIPDVSQEELRAAWEKTLRGASRTEVQTFIDRFMPHALVAHFLDAIGSATGRRMAEVSRDERGRILSGLKGWVPGRLGEIPIDRGEVTAGGIALDEVSSRTFESRRCRSLYVVGEALDIAGSVGGYNLQAAFSTGWVAGRSAATAAHSDDTAT